MAKCYCFVVANMFLLASRQWLQFVQHKVSLWSLFVDGWPFAESNRKSLGLEDVYTHKANQTKGFSRTTRTVDIQLHGLLCMAQRSTRLCVQQRWMCERVAWEKLWVERRTVCSRVLLCLRRSQWINDIIPLFSKQWYNTIAAMLLAVLVMEEWENKVLIIWLGWLQNPHA